MGVGGRGGKKGEERRGRKWEGEEGGRGYLPQCSTLCGWILAPSSSMNERGG